MTCSDITVIMGRIKTAPIKSPIAVFNPALSEDRLSGMLNAVPFNAAQTKAWIKAGNPRFIGMFDSTMDPDKVRRILRSAVNTNRISERSRREIRHKLVV